MFSIGYFLKLARYLFTEKNISRANYFAIFDQVDPKVIISFSTMTQLMAKYSVLRPEKLVIGIQTAVRPENFTKKFMRRASTYFAFGKAELDLCRIHSIPTKESVPIGSYQLGIYVSRNKIETHDSDLQWALCFISGYRKEYDYNRYPPRNRKSNWGSPEEWETLRFAHECLFGLVAKYAHENDLRLVVVGRQRHEKLDQVDEKERQYFEMRAGQCNLEIICDRKSALSSYRGAMNSRLVVHLYSTMGWELFGIGKKVLFGGGLDSDLVKVMDIGYWTKFLPTEVHITSPSYREFRLKASALLSMSSQNYTSLTRSPARYYMEHDSRNPPHIVIGKKIRQHLDKDI